MRATLFMLSLASLLLAGCDVDDPGKPNDGGQFGEETNAGCKEQSSTTLGWDEVATNGRTAQELVDLTEGLHAETLTWSDSSETALTIEVSGAANPRFIDYEWESEGNGGIEPAIGCVDTVGVDVTLSVSTADGQLDEQWTHTLELGDYGDVTAWIELEGLVGSFDVWDWTTESYDEAWADLEIRFEPAGPSGEIHGYGETTHGTGPDSAVSLEIFEVASF